MPDQTGPALRCVIAERAAMATMLAGLWNNVLVWRRAALCLATLSSALLVAAIIAREPPDFAVMPIIAVVRDGDHHPVWAIRLAREAHQIAAESLRPQPLPPDRVYQLWLLVPDGTAPRPLGLLPQAARKPIAVSPETARQLTGEGELEVTLEPAGGSPLSAPSGPAVFRGTLDGSG
jgi:anti-sigma-K factor RskA